MGRQDYCEIYDTMYYEKIADIMVTKKCFSKYIVITKITDIMVIKKML